MPHVLIKLWPGKSREQKTILAEAIATDLQEILGSTEKAISIAFEEVPSEEWTEKVYRPEIEGKPEQLFKKPGY